MQPSQEELMRQLEREANGCYAWSNRPGDHYAPHTHSYEKVLYCVRGTITFHVEQGDLELAAGDRMVLPAGTVHSADVGEAGVTCIEGRR